MFLGHADMDYHSNDPTAIGIEGEGNKAFIAFLASRRLQMEKLGNQIEVSTETIFLKKHLIRLTTRL